MSVSNTVVVTLCDEKYFQKAACTIRDIRSVGQYWGDLVLVTIGFIPPVNFTDFYKITVKHFQQIDVSKLMSQLKQHPFTRGDKRETTKIAQWNKLYIFDNYFNRWDRLIFFDAGFRVLGSLQHYLDVPWEGHITALDDSHPEDVKRFNCQIELSSRPDKIEELQRILPDALDMRYFLNCFWIHDTRIIKENTFDEMVDLMNRFPICLNNEMCIMNIYFAIKRQWQPLQIKMSDGKFLMDWSERNGNTWRSYVGLKYPRTITMEPEKEPCSRIYK